MSRGKLVMSITIGLMATVLIAVIFIQFRTVEEVDETSIETMREEELRTELSTWKTRYEEVEKKLTETLATIDEYNQRELSEQEKVELMETELAQANMYLGKTDVVGPRYSCYIKR